MKKLFFFLLLFSFLLACTDVPGRAKDDEIRLVSTAPALTEMILALHLHAELVGVSNYCLLPDSMRSMPRVGGLLDINPEVIVALQPNYVMALPSTSAKLDNVLPASIEIVVFPTGNSADVKTALTKLGHQFERQRRARQLIRTIEAELAVPDSQTRASAIIVVARSEDQLRNIFVAGPQSYFGEILRASGFANAFTGLDKDYHEVGLESIIEANPDYIFETAVDSSQTLHWRRLRHPWYQVSHLKAVQRARVYQFQANFIHTPGLRILSLVRLLQEIAADEFDA
jgi:iron complex transport system substrate-binding protein